MSESHSTGIGSTPVHDGAATAPERTPAHGSRGKGASPLPAGLCGQVWERTFTGATGWTEHKTQTGGHVWGMQFPSHDRGYVVGMGGELNQCIVRLNR